MAGLGKLLKQMQKVKSQMETTQEELAKTTLEVSSGGGAVVIKISGSGEFKSLQLNADLLKESNDFVEETILVAINEAAEKAKAFSNEKMGSLTAGMGLPDML